MNNVDIVKQAYASFATGDIPDVLSLFDPAIEWCECKGVPIVKVTELYWPGSSCHQPFHAHPEYLMDLILPLRKFLVPTIKW